MSSSLLPEFSFEIVFVEPWRSLAWVAVLGFLVALANGLVGCFLLLRRMALAGDAISHSALPGIAGAFLLANSLGGWLTFAGALAAGLATAFLIEMLHRRSRLKEDAAMGIVFTTLFALGVVMISVFASDVHLDPDCVLYGELGAVASERSVVLAGFPLAPAPVLRLALVAVLVVAFVAGFYKQLVATAFDPELAPTLGMNPRAVHYALMAALAVVVVASFEAVGSILVVAMLVLPGATARLLSDRLPRILALIVLHAIASTILGFHLAVFLDVEFGGAMVTSGFLLFCAAWVLSPSQGLVPRWVRRSLLRRTGTPDPASPGS